MNYKLIRDKIPEIAKAQGTPIKYAVIDNQDFLRELADNKLKEEVGEYLASHSLEELADVMTCLTIAVESLGYTMKDLNEVYAKKIDERGGFSKHIIGLFDDEGK